MPTDKAGPLSFSIQVIANGGATAYENAVVEVTCSPAVVIIPPTKLSDGPYQFGFESGMQNYTFNTFMTDDSYCPIEHYIFDIADRVISVPKCIEPKPVSSTATVSAASVDEYDACLKTIYVST